ncbi:hypothetical protein BGZ93_000460 [Podila epicladia]|nr:hypothetical protein BGZ93_000460 [Podila epicladia]
MSPPCPRAAVEADAPQPTTAVVLVPGNAYLERVHKLSSPYMFEKRQVVVPPIGGSSSSTPTSTAGPVVPTQVPPVTNATTSATATTSAGVPTTSSVPAVVTTVSRSTTGTGTRINATSSIATPTPTAATPAESETKMGLVFGILGGLVAAIGAAIVAFKCVMSRKDRARRNKEIAATLAESFDRSGGSDKYHELGDGASTPIPAGAKLSRQGSQQDGYYQKEQGGDYYNNHYVQERYGGPNGAYDETEMSVMGGQGGGPRPMSPYMGQAPSGGGGGGGGQYAGYNDYDYDYGNGGNGGYNNHGHQQAGYGYGQRY